MNTILLRLQIAGTGELSTNFIRGFKNNCQNSSTNFELRGVLGVALATLPFVYHMV